MTKDSGFKKVVRRHAEQTGQRYTEALSDLEDLEGRMFHQPVAERLLEHLRGHYGIDTLTATQVSVHRADVFRIDRNDGDPWIARAFPPRRPRAGAEGMPPSCGSWPAMTTPLNAWQQTTPYPSSRAAPSW